jgi:hypothetical protein
MLSGAQSVDNCAGCTQIVNEAKLESSDSLF